MFAVIDLSGVDGKGMTAKDDDSSDEEDEEGMVGDDDEGTSGAGDEDREKRVAGLEDELDWLYKQYRDRMARVSCADTAPAVTACVFIIVYLDDILIFSQNNEEHTHHMRLVLEQLRQNHLFVWPKKCHFRVTTVDYVGLMITPRGISMEQGKVKDVLEWPEPKTVKQTQAFLGFCNFYRRFIPDFSTIARPLHDLTQKGKAWKWEEREQEAFQQIKEAIAREPVLVHPDPKQPYILETDALGVAMGTILSQRKEDGKLHPITFMSKSFNPAQQNYDTYNKELLAIVEALKHW
ncbi:hypothetical protein FRC06_011819 [Ceratobasidium sp. 370]|nr:hypothetical protein FRC06_011819 [Ceratobasidium sp. 370]